LAAGVFIVTINSCSKHETVRAPLPENPQRIPCDECEPFAGYYELRDVTVNTINGAVVWSPLPVSTIFGKIFAGYIDSALLVGPEKEPGTFYPHPGSQVNRIDTIIWDRCRYVRQ